MAAMQPIGTVADYDCGNVVCCSVDSAKDCAPHAVFGSTMIAVMRTMSNRTFPLYVRANAGDFVSRYSASTNSGSPMSDRSDPIAFVCCWCCCCATVNMKSHDDDCSLKLFQGSIEFGG